VSDLHWLAPKDASKFSGFREFHEPGSHTDDFFMTLVAINGNTIGNNLIVDLWPEDTGRPSFDNDISPKLHKFEAIGVKAGGLVIDFAGRNETRVTTAVDGLTFDRLYDGHASCEYGGSPTTPAYDDRSLLIIPDFTEELQLPSVENALRWLDLNTVSSTQPYTAFATAFSKAGVDSTAITVARASLELCERAAHWLPHPVLKLVCKDAATRRENGGKQSSSSPTPQTPPAVKEDGWYKLGTAIVSIPNELSDLGQLGFRGGLYFLADHGYRPAKVLWWVTLTLVFFWALFLWPLKVVAYTSRPDPASPAPSDTATPKLRPLGFIFLFDRLLPAYQIDRTHYKIEGYFKRIPLSAVTNGASAPKVRRLLFFEWPVERITSEGEIEIIENTLGILRILGLVFAIFLAAAVSSLILR
jgi:hypothetical protein